MDDKDLIIAVIIVVIIGVATLFKDKLSLKFQLVLSVACTTYLIIDLINHPESKGKFIIIIDLAWILKNFRKLKNSSHT